LVCATAAFACYWLVRSTVAPGLERERSAATLTLFLAAAAALALVARPYTWWRAGLVGAMVAGFALVAATSTGRRFFALDFSDWRTDLVALGTGALAALALAALRRMAVRPTGP
jgi:cation-transporting ATPase E